MVGYDSERESPHPGKDLKDATEARPKSESRPEPGFQERGVGTGVVIVDNGTILTNLHVVLGAEKREGHLLDGLEADARLVSVMPEHDLAVLRAHEDPRRPASPRRCAAPAT